MSKEKIKWEYVDNCGWKILAVNIFALICFFKAFLMITDGMETKLSYELSGGCTAIIGIGLYFNHRRELKRALEEFEKEHKNEQE